MPARLCRAREEGCGGVVQLAELAACKVENVGAICCESMMARSAQIIPDWLGLTMSCDS